MILPLAAFPCCPLSEFLRPSPLAPELVCSVSSGVNLAIAFYVKCKLELSKYQMNLCMYQVTDAC